MQVNTDYIENSGIELHEGHCTLIYCISELFKNYSIQLDENTKASIRIKLEDILKPAPGKVMPQNIIYHNLKYLAQKEVIELKGKEHDITLEVSINDNFDQISGFNTFANCSK